MTLPSFSSAIFTVYRAFPPNVRFRLKSLLGVNGHASGFVDSLKAARHARELKRLDRAMASLATDLAAAQINSLTGTRCLELGSGFVLTHAASMYLLGADRVVATDLNRIASLEALKQAVLDAPAESLFFALPPFADVELARTRLETLRSAIAQGWEGLEQIGIEYLAPVDLSHHHLSEPLDFIYSISVLEHIAEPIVVGILQNLARSLAESGVMVHAIHLEDHRDMFGAPFDFLRKDTDYNPLADIDTRGNRLRADDWINIFGNLSGVATEVVSQTVKPENFPNRAELSTEFQNRDLASTFCSNLTIKTRPAFVDEATSAR